MKTNLQYFADPDKKPVDPNNDPDAKPKKYTQENVDKMMAAKDAELRKDFEKQIADLKADFAKQKNDLIDQGKQLAGETAQQEAQRKLDAMKESLDRKTKEITQKELELKQKNALTATKQLLSDKKLPISFAEQLADVDPDVRQNNVEKFAESWQAELNKQIEDKVKGTHTPQSGSQNTNTNVTAEQFAQMGITQRMALATSNPDLYNSLNGGNN